jgi:Subtilase family
MNWKWFWAPLLICGLCSSPAKADNRIIVRTTLGLQGLQAFCGGLPLLQNCTVVGGLDGSLGQLFLVTTPADLTTFLNLLGSTVGIVDAEADQLLNLVGGLNQVTTPPAGLSDTTPVQYSGSTVWDGYVNQPSAGIVHVSQAQTTFKVMGTGIVADIDTGVDPSHPALKAVLLPGYDFTRNQPGGSEMTDYTGAPPSGSTTNIANVNQSTAAVLDQSTAAVLDTSQYAAFGHGTMVMGIIHLVAPTAQLLPLKAFSSNGTGYLSDILHAAYYGVQNGANVINMSFDMTSNSLEFNKALDYANQNGVICSASAGNDGMLEIVYPAAYQNDVMGVASTSDTDTPSAFSNYGDAIVWVAAPGEGIISTYPFGTYAAGWGTSFSAPFVSGAGALLLNLDPTMNESKAAAAVAHAVPLGSGMGNGRLDLMQALQSVSPQAGTPPDFNVSLSPSGETIHPGDSATYTVSVAPSGGFNKVVMFSCSGLPQAASCTVTPSSVTLDGTNASSARAVIATTKAATAQLTVN